MGVEMSLLQFEKSIVGHKQKTLKQGQRLTVRRHQCRKCNSVLALQISMSALDKQSDAEYYVVREAIWVKDEPLLMYDKARWFGNHIKCPVCGREGKLPLDKPLNWENMQRRNDVAIQSN